MNTTEYWANMTKGFKFGDDILWNYNKLAWIFESTSNPIIKLGQGNTDVIGNEFHYENLPKYLSQSLPLLGTREITNGGANTFYLPKTTLVYMVIQQEDSAEGEDVIGWTYTGDRGYYFGKSSNHPFGIYQKILSPGLHHVYENNAFYLFVPG